MYQFPINPNQTYQVGEAFLSSLECTLVQIGQYLNDISDLMSVMLGSTDGVVAGGEYGADAGLVAQYQPLTILVHPGRFMLATKPFHLAEGLVVQLQPQVERERIDCIVASHKHRNFLVVQGQGADYPVVPVLDDYMLPLAQVRIQGTSMTITDTRTVINV